MTQTVAAALACHAPLITGRREVSNHHLGTNPCLIRRGFRTRLRT